MIRRLQIKFVATCMALVTAGLAVVFLAVCAYTLITPPKYSSTAQTYATYSDASVEGGDISSINSASSYISNQIRSYPTLATTEAVLQPVIDDLGLKMTVGQLADLLTVENPENTAFVNITVEDGNPQQSAAIANAVAESLQDVVENSLYDSDRQSPVKLSIVQQAQEPTSPSSPNVPLYMAIGLVGGLILGDFAVGIGWLMPEVIVYMSFVAIANFTQPSYELGYAFKFLRMGMLILTAIFDVWGFVGGLVGCMILLATNATVNRRRSYLYPLIPFNGHALKRLFLRVQK